MIPEQTVIAITFEDGFVGIMHFITKEVGDRGVNWSKDGSDKEIQEQIDTLLHADNPYYPYNQKVTSWTRIKGEDLPIDRTFRHAWRHDGKKFTHDMKKVREIHVERQRIARIPLLEQLDREWMKAMGQGNKVEADRIELERQKLRDLPTTIQPELEKAKTPEEVRKIGLI